MAPASEEGPGRPLHAAGSAGTEVIGGGRRATPGAAEPQPVVSDLRGRGRRRLHERRRSGAVHIDNQIHARPYSYRTYPFRQKWCGTMKKGRHTNNPTACHLAHDFVLGAHKSLGEPAWCPTQRKAHQTHMPQHLYVDMSPARAGPRRRAAPGHRVAASIGGDAEAAELAPPPPGCVLPTA